MCLQSLKYLLSGLRRRKFANSYSRRVLPAVQVTCSLEFNRHSLSWTAGQVARVGNEESRQMRYLYGTLPAMIPTLSQMIFPKGLLWAVSKYRKVKRIVPRAPPDHSLDSAIGFCLLALSRICVSICLCVQQSTWSVLLPPLLPQFLPLLFSGAFRVSCRQWSTSSMNTSIHNIN